MGCVGCESREGFAGDGMLGEKGLETRFGGEGFCQSVAGLDGVLGYWKFVGV